MGKKKSLPSAGEICSGLHNWACVTGFQAKTRMLLIQWNARAWTRINGGGGLVTRAPHGGNSIVQALPNIRICRTLALVARRREIRISSPD